MAINIALKYLVLYLLLFNGWNPAESAGSDNTLEQSITTKYSTDYTVNNVKRKSSEENKYNVQIIEEARTSSTHHSKSYRKVERSSFTESASEAESPKALPKHLKQTPEEFKLRASGTASVNKPIINLIDLDVKNKTSTNEVTYLYNQQTDVHQFLAKEGYAFRQVTKGNYLVWQYQGSQYGYEVIIITENGESSCRVNFSDYSHCTPIVPQARAYVYPQTLSRTSTSGISVPSDGSDFSDPNVHHVILDIKNKFSQGPITYRRDPGKDLELFTIQEPYTFGLILKGHKVLWDYKGGDYPCAALLKRGSSGRQKLKVYFSRDLDFVGLPKIKVDPNSHTQTEARSETLKHVTPTVENTTEFGPKLLYDVQYTLDMLSASVAPPMQYDGGLVGGQPLIEGRDYINLDMRAPSPYIGPQVYQVPDGYNLIHSIDIDLSPKKAQVAGPSGAQASGADGGIHIDDSRPPKQEPLHSGDEQINLVDGKAPVVENLHSDGDNGINLVDRRASPGRISSEDDTVVIERRRRPAFVATSAGQIGVPIQAGYVPDPMMTFTGAPGYGQPFFSSYTPQVAPMGAPMFQPVETSPLGMTAGAGGYPQPIPFPQDDGYYYVEEIPIVTSVRPRESKTTVRIEGEAEVEEVTEEDEILVEEVFESDTDNETKDFDVVVVTAPQGRKVTLNDIKDKEKEASQAQTKDPKDQKVSSMLSKDPKTGSGLLGKSAEPPKVEPPKAEPPKATPATRTDRDIFSHTYQPVYSRRSHASNVRAHSSSSTSASRFESKSASADTGTSSLTSRLNQASKATSKTEDQSSKEDSSKTTYTKYVKLPTDSSSSTTGDDKAASTQPGKPASGAAKSPSDSTTPKPGQVTDAKAAAGQKAKEAAPSDQNPLSCDDDDLFTEYYSPLLAKVSYPEKVEIAPPQEYAGLPIGYEEDIFDTMYETVYSSRSYWSEKLDKTGSSFDIFSPVYEPFYGGSSTASQKKAQPAQGVLNPAESKEGQKAAPAQPPKKTSSEDDDMFNEWYTPTYSGSAHSSTSTSTTPSAKAQATATRRESIKPAGAASNLGSSTRTATPKSGSTATPASSGSTTPKAQSAGSTSGGEDEFNIDDSSSSKPIELQIFTLNSDNSTSQNDTTKYECKEFGISKNMYMYTFNKGAKCVKVKFGSKEWNYDSSKYSGKYPEKVVHNTTTDELAVVIDDDNRTCCILVGARNASPLLLFLSISDLLWIILTTLSFRSSSLILN
ncbi:hypothetical protein MACJ_000416 [Theileria orientalis]|uniref:Uncharacterized protein n=1 Tax=Theileria orientalis TaxID=68886 RepID=A0A976M596_THEOR|nr:hypothetical protein MACJ_000416 [Theileria orientalis]